MWVLGAALVLAAAVGFTGSGGPFSRTTAVDGVLSVDHPRFTRRAADEYLVVRVRDAASPMVEMSLRGSLMDDLEVVALRPAPASEAGTAGAVTYRFRAAGASDLLRVVLQFESRGWGVRDLVVTGRGATVRSTIFVLP